MFDSKYLSLLSEGQPGLRSTTQCTAPTIFEKIVPSLLWYKSALGESDVGEIVHKVVVYELCGKTRKRARCILMC